MSKQEIKVRIQNNPVLLENVILIKENTIKEKHLKMIAKDKEQRMKSSFWFKVHSELVKRGVFNSIEMCESASLEISLEKGAILMKDLPILRMKDSELISVLFSEQLVEGKTLEDKMNVELKQLHDNHNLYWFNIFRELERLGHGKASELEEDGLTIEGYDYLTNKDSDELPSFIKKLLKEF